MTADERANDTAAETTLVERLSTAVIVVQRPDLSIAYLNGAAEELLGVSRRQVLSRPLTGVAAFEAAWARRLEQAGSDGEAVSGRELALTVRGQRHLVDLTLTPMPDDNAAGDLVLELSAVDRHRRIAREEALRAQEQANRSLLRGLAHEIRNPLAGLRGAAQLLEQELANGDLREHTRIIAHETERLCGLVERMTGPAQPLKRSSVNIHEVTERVRALLQAEAGPGVTIATDYDPSVPRLDADCDRLIQSVLNLGRNALQAVDDSGRVTLRTGTQRQFTLAGVRHRLVALIEVVDTGPGIGDDQVEALFQPMVSGRAEGSGLGLTIAQTLVGQHGGLIEVDSEPGHTVFRVVLPLARDGEPA